MYKYQNSHPVRICLRLNLFLVSFFFLITCGAHAGELIKGDTGELTDSMLVFQYPSCIQMFKVKYGNNRSELRRLREYLKSFNPRKDFLYMDGYSGNCRSGKADLNTSFRRCINLKGFLINYCGLKERNFKTVNHSFSHNRNGEVVTISFTSPVSGCSDIPVNDTGDPGKETVEKQVAPDSPREVVIPPRPVMVNDSLIILKENSAEDKSDVSDIFTEKPYYAIQTNLIGWAMGLVNVAADLQVGKSFSIQLPLLWSSWDIGRKYALRTFAVQPEGRWWIGKPGKGHFIGLHAQVGWFNLKWNDDRYQDSGRPLVGAGVSYGFALPLSPDLGMEFTLGAGYANLRYDTYYNIDNGARINTLTKNYWGITRAGISFFYRF